MVQARRELGWWGHPIEYANMAQMMIMYIHSLKWKVREFVARRVQQSMHKLPEGKFLRISADGASCSTNSCVIDWVPAKSIYVRIHGSISWNDSEIHVKIRCLPPGGKLLPALGFHELTDPIKHRKPSRLMSSMGLAYLIKCGDRTSVTHSNSSLQTLIG